MQALAALATVIAGLTSVVAIFVSLQAVQVSEQQRADTLRQRAEDKETQASAEAEAAELERTAYVTRIDVRPDYARFADGLGYRYRNSNSQQASLFVRKERNGNTEFLEYELEPCSEGYIHFPFRPFRDSSLDIDMGVIDSSGRVRRPGDGGPVEDPKFWDKGRSGFGVVHPKPTRRDILPCT